MVSRHGSGTGATMVYGNLQTDEVLLNHSARYFPMGTPERVDLSDRLPEVRRLIRAEQCRDATGLMRDACVERTGRERGTTSSGRAPYQPFCTVRVAAGTDGPFRNYRRGVDFATGRAWVKWSDDSGTFTREVFVSRLSDRVFLRIRGSHPGSASCRLNRKGEDGARAARRAGFRQSDLPAAPGHVVGSSSTATSISPSRASPEKPSAVIWIVYSPAFGNVRDPSCPRTFW